MADEWLWPLTDTRHRPDTRAEAGTVRKIYACAITRKPSVMLKAYDGVWGAYQMVGTRYKSMWDGDRFRPNCGMFAERIFGVIFASWDKDGNLLWERDLDSFPATLGSTPTLHGEVTAV